LLVRGVFVFSELAPTNPPLAHSIYASGLVNIFAYATELAPTNTPLAHSIYASGLLNIFAYATKLAPTNTPVAFAVTPLGGLDYVLRTSAMGSGGFLFLCRVPVRGRWGQGGQDARPTSG